MSDTQAELTELREIVAELAGEPEPSLTHWIPNTFKIGPNPLHALWLRAQRWKK